jgi:phosphoribosylaminoimidazole carboxylase
VLDPLGPSSPAGQLSHLCIEGSFQDANKIKELSVISDVITTEIEHVNTDELMELEKSGVVIHPNPQTLRIIQDKYAQKVYLSDNGISVPDFMNIPDVQAGVEAGLRYGYPFMMKNKRLAYDGRGNAVVRSADDVSIKFSLLGSNEIYAERFIPFVKELAVMIVRTKDGILSYPVVETIQLNNICHIVTAPAQVSSVALQAAERLARRAISSLDGYGIYGVEMFLLNDDTVLLNEIAPR